LNFYEVFTSSQLSSSPLVNGIWYKVRRENQVTRTKYLAPRTQLPAVIQHQITNTQYPYP
jgi:hypothetical protein